MVAEGRLISRQNGIMRREKRLLKLTPGDQKIVSDFKASLGALNRARFRKCEKRREDSL